MLISLSCSKDKSIENLKESISDDGITSGDSIENIWKVNRQDQYAINVIFFKPSDFEFTEEVKNNVSELMLYVQKWYEKQMELNNFDKKTFGLITNQFGVVRIHVIESDKPSSYYHDKEQIQPYSTLKELNQAVSNFFNSNPSLKESEHNFILSNEESLIRLVGSGKNAYTRSPDFSLHSTGKFIEDLELMTSNKLGGTMHELAHGLNVPHNAHRKSNLPMVSLMSYGNHVYERNQPPASEDLVFLTKTSAAILNVNQAFNKKTNGVNYYSGSEIELLSFKVQKDESTGMIHAEGSLLSPNTLTNYYIGHNGGEGIGNNYDEVTFTGEFLEKNNEKYSFEIDMPYHEIFNGYKDDEKDLVLFNLNILSKNGERKNVYSYTYNIDLETQVPDDNINFSYQKHEFSNRSSWIISTNSVSPNAERVATTMVDGDLDTYWHSKYPYNIANEGPHEIVIDMNRSIDFSGIYMHSYRSGNNYRPKHGKILISDDNLEFTTIREFSNEHQRSDLSLKFANTVSARYIKVLVNQVYTSNGSEENLILNEVDILTQ